MFDPAKSALILDDAAHNATAVAQLTMTTPFDLVEAYSVQRAWTRHRVKQGDTVVGVKLGFTSKAKAVQMGVSDVIIGTLFDRMRIDDGGEVDVSRLIHPRVEPEIAFRLLVDVNPADSTADATAAAVEVAPALEIIDSRYRDFKFTLQDVVADNTSAAGFVIGPWRSLGQLESGPDLSNLAVTLGIDDAVAETGSTGAILGGPVRALAAAKRLAGCYGLSLPAGSIVLAGAATAAVPLPGRGSSVTARIAGLGSVSCTMGGES
jgi:2-oxo-3-hexenedioate decarboxylase